MNKNIKNNATRGTILTLLLLGSSGASADSLGDLLDPKADSNRFADDTRYSHPFEDLFGCFGKPNKKENLSGHAVKPRQCLGLTRKELIVAGLVIGISFAIADAHININSNSIKVSVPIR